MIKMKKLFTLSLALILALVRTVSVSAAPFVPSITNKGAPDLIVIDTINGKDVVGFITDPDGNKISTEYKDCLIITSITEALNNDDIPDKIRVPLIDVYNEFKDGKKLSDACPELSDIVKEGWDKDKTPDDLVIKDLFDISHDCDDIANHFNNGNMLDLTFDLGISGGTFITAIVYIDGKWVPVKDCINNGDGTVTVKFTEICPVAFLVPGNGQNIDIVSPTTSDMSGIILWGSVMVASLLAIVALIVYRRRVNG